MNYRIDKKTKIVCTIGPSSQDKETMKKLLESGMTCMRLNFSHGTHAEQKEKIETLREIEREENLIIPICLDTKGPEIRTSCFEGGKADFNKGDIVRIYMGVEKLGTSKAFGVNYKNLYHDCKVNDILRLDDGNMELVIKEKDESSKELV